VLLRRRQTDAARLERKRLQEEEEKTVKILEAKVTEKIRQEKLRQAIRENSVELRELEHKLHNAQASKQRAAQIQEKALLKQREKVEEANVVGFSAAHSERRCCIRC
jgi:hypothetical protein